MFVFDEPTIGLHPLDVQTLLGVFRTLIDNGATVIVIEHDLDVIRSADYIVDMGPGGGDKRRPCGGRRHPSADQSHTRKCDRTLCVKVKPNHSPGVTQQVVPGFLFSNNIQSA